MELKMEEQNTAQSKMGKSPLISILEFDFFISRDRIRKWLPFAIYLFFLAMIYIANSHQADKVIVNTARLQNRVKELRSEYISLKKELMSNSRQTEVQKKVAQSGLKSIKIQPVTIYTTFPETNQP